MTNERCLAGAVEGIAAEAVALGISRPAISTSRIRRCVRGAAFVALGLLTGCGEQNRYVAPPPPKVIVSLPLQQPLTRYLETTGNAAAFNSVDLMARVQGFLQEIKYQDGAQVVRGTSLFVIEPEPYKLKLDQAQAAEAGAQATLKQAEAEYKRQADLAGKGFSSQSALDQALANRDSAQANLRQAQANKQSSWC